MSVDAAGQDILSILRMFSSPRMGPFENTNAPAPQPPPAALANAQNSGNERQSESEPSGPPQPVARKAIPDGGPVPVPAPAAPADVPAVGAIPVAGSAAPAPADAGMPGFVSDNPVYQAWEAQRRRLFAEAQERQKIDLSAAGFGDVARAFGGTVTGGVGSPGGGGITRPGADAATGQSMLTLEQFSKFKEAEDAAKATAADLARMDVLVRDPRMAGVTKEALLTIKANDPKKYAEIIKDYFSGETDTKVDPTTGAIVSRPKFGQPDAPYRTVYRSPETEAKALLDRVVKGQEVIDPRLQSDDVLRQIARATNQPEPDDPRTLAMLRSMSPQKLQEMIEKTATAAAGVSQPREWEGKEIEAQRVGREKINASVGSMSRLEYLTSKIDDGMRTGSWIGDTLNRFNREIGTFIGVERGTRNADEYNAAVQAEVQQVIKQYGANASDRDREAAEKSFGAGLGPESARAQLSFVAKSKVWEVAKHNANIQDRIDNAGMTAGNRQALEAQKVAYPKPTEQNLHTMNIAPAAVEALKANPTPEMREAFRDKYGDNMAEWILGEAK